MKYIAICRHGKYTGAPGGGALSQAGQAKVTALASALQRYASGLRIAILTSTAGRARESAQLIADTLGGSIEAHEILWSDATRATDRQGVLRLLREAGERADFVIIVTHLEYLMMLPRAVFSEVLSAELPRGTPSVQKGEALLIDVEQKSAVLIP